MNTLLRAQYLDARALAEELAALAARDPDPLLGTVAHRALGMTAVFCGEFGAARTHLEQGVVLYRPDVDHARAIRDYGGPAHVSCLAFLSRPLWALGYPDQALARSLEALTEARSRGGALSLATALGLLASQHQLRGDVHATREVSEQALAHATEWGSSYWMAQATVLRSWAEAHLLPREASRAQADATRKSLEGYYATGTTLGLSRFLSLLADVYGMCGQPGEGLKTVDEALAHVEKSGERYQEPELHRLRGELLLMRGGAEVAAAVDACFHRALQVARAQDAKAWELRAATSLSRRLREQGLAREAYALLAPVYEWFREGFDSADLQAARGLLQEFDMLR
jgi:predicted ATPase